MPPRWPPMNTMRGTTRMLMENSTPCARETRARRRGCGLAPGAATTSLSIQAKESFIMHRRDGQTMAALAYGGVSLCRPGLGMNRMN